MSQRATWARYLGAIALLGVGLVHLEQFAVDHYSAVPTIGTLFALNFASAALIAGGLLAPVQRLPGRAGRMAGPVLACGGIAVAAGSLAGLVASESDGLFGFMESGYRSVIVLSIALELATAAVLSAHLVWTRAPRDRRDPWRGPAAGPPRDRRGRSRGSAAGPAAGPPWAAGQIPRMPPLNRIEPAPGPRFADDPGRRIDELLERLRALVFARGLLEARDADELELRANQREIRLTREHLARAVESRQSHSPPPAACRPRR